jgi:hypothetical protein
MFSLNSEVEAGIQQRVIRAHLSFLQVGEFSLAPGFSRVWRIDCGMKRFQPFLDREMSEAVETAEPLRQSHHRAEARC